jgi:putative ABC transport system substrate-binding protein
MRAFAQSTKTRIGILWHAGNEEEELPFLTPLVEGLRRLGYVDGRNIELIHTYAAERAERFASNADALLSKRIDILVSVSPTAAVAAKRATQTIPTVFIVHPDPVGAGLVQSLAHPGGNITGISNLITDLTAKRLDLFKQAVPELSSVMLLTNPSNPVVAKRDTDEAMAAASRLGINVSRAEARTPEDIQAILTAPDQRNVDGLFTGLDSLFTNERERVARLALARRLPTMVANDVMVAWGALMSYGPRFPELFTRGAAVIAKIIRGASPSEIPVEQSSRFEFVVNLRTAKALGLTIPSSVLARADEVLE